MEKQQKKQVKKYISWVLIVAIVALLAFLPMLAADKQQVSGPQASILSTTAELREISTAVLGGGTLAAADGVNITIPEAVKVTEYLVKTGDLVSQGQPIATVDRVSVMTAITQVQETMVYLQEQLEDASGESAADTVTAAAGGIVKFIYAAEGETVQDVMLRDGALAVLSLDGMMAVQVERQSDLSGGDSVCVILSDGTETTGKVESNYDGVLTITIEDDDYTPGEKVTVTTEEDERIGSGTLYIHSPWKVVAYSGTISDVRVSVGDQVSAGKTLFDLDNAGFSVSFEALSSQHREYEALMLELFQMYQTETVTAPAAGMITGVDETGTYMLSSMDGKWELSLLMNAPNGDDVTTYMNYIGRVADVGIDGWILKLNPYPLTIADYKDLSSVPMDPNLMTEDAIYSANAPIYELTEGEWVQIGSDAIVAGDILLFAGDPEGNFVWVVRLQQKSAAPDMPADPTEPAPDDSVPAEPSDPTMPSEPSDSTIPETPSDSAGTTVPTIPNQSGITFPQIGGSMPGISGGMTQEEAFELYGLETVTIASVTAQTHTSVQITVDESDISKIFIGQEATVTVNALMGEQFTGTVTSISSSGENEGGNSKFTVEVTMKKIADMLPGMRASVCILLATTEETICVPVAALTEAGTQTLVYTGYDEETESFTQPIQVTTGVSDGEFVQILSGLDAGQAIYYPYYDTLVTSNAPDLAGGGFPFG